MKTCKKCKKPLTPYQLIEDKALKAEAISFKNSTEYSRKTGKLTRPSASAPKKVQYGAQAEKYGSVFGNGKVEMNKTAGYIVKQQGSMIRTEGKFSIFFFRIFFSIFTFFF